LHFSNVQLFVFTTPRYNKFPWSQIFQFLQFLTTNRTAIISYTCSRVFHPFSIASLLIWFQKLCFLSGLFLIRLSRTSTDLYALYHHSPGTKDKSLALPSDLLAMQTRSIRGTCNYSLSLSLSLSLSYLLGQVPSLPPSTCFYNTASANGSAKFSPVRQRTLPSSPVLNKRR